MISQIAVCSHTDTLRETKSSSIMSTRAVRRDDEPIVQELDESSREGIIFCILECCSAISEAPKTPAVRLSKDITLWEIWIKLPTKPSQRGNNFNQKEKR